MIEEQLIELKKMTGASIKYEKNIWVYSWEIEAKTSHVLWFSNTEQHYYFNSLEKLHEYIRIKKILFRKFNIVAFSDIPRNYTTLRVKIFDNLYDELTLHYTISFIKDEDLETNEIFYEDFQIETYDLTPIKEYFLKAVAEYFTKRLKEEGYSWFLNCSPDKLTIYFS